MESLAGKSIGDYKLAEAIGAGSTGEVLKAEDDSGSPHALKVLHQALSLPSRVETYWEEVQMVGVLAHRHITVAKSADWSKSGRFYLSMPLLKGMDLAAVLEKNEKLPAIQAVRLAGQACLALEAAHAEGIVHGALKPSNLFLVAGKDAETFSTRVLDFGTCHLLDPESSNEDGSIVGASNPEYLAPEQLTGEAVKASDVYALAALLCRCLTGRAPITGTRDEIIKALDTVDLSLPDELSEGLTKLLIKALPKKPEDRYADASKLREALEQWAATSPEELTAAPLALFTDLPPSPAAAPTPPPKAAAASGVPKKDAEPAKKTPAPKEPEEEATVEKETKATKKTKASKETKDTSAKSPAAAGSPQDDELAAIAQEAQTQLTEKKDSAKKKGPPPKKKKKKKKSAPVESFRDGDGDLVELPVERSVKAFVAGLPNDISPDEVAPAKTNGNAETIDAAVEQFIDQARAWSAALPPEVTDEAKLAALAKPPVVEKVVEKEIPAAAPLAMPAQESGGNGKLVPAAAIAAVLSGLLVFGVTRMMAPEATECDHSADIAAPTAAVGEDINTAAAEPTDEPQAAPLDDPAPEPTGEPAGEPTPTAEPLAGSDPEPDPAPAAAPAPAAEPAPAPAAEPAPAPAAEPAPAPAPAAKPRPAKVAAKKKKIRKKRPRKKKSSAAKKASAKKKKKPAKKKKKKAGSGWVDPFSQ